MSSGYIVKPIIVDGIEFYVDPVTGESGMSLSGIGRLCDVDPSNIRRHVERQQKRLAQTHSKTPETVDSIDDSVWLNPDLDFKGSNNARVIRDDVCAAIVEYYAFDSEYATTTALFSYRKFAKLGIRAWIHQVTGYAEAQDLTKLAETMNLLLQEIKELRVETREYKAIRRQNDSYFAGLNDLMDELADTEVKALPSGDEQGRYTVAEWLNTRGITLDKSQLHKLAAMAAFTYRTLTKKDPTVVYRYSTQSSKTKKVNGYLEAEFPILNIALTKLFQP